MKIIDTESKAHSYPSVGLEAAQPSDGGRTSSPFVVDSDEAANWVVRRVIETRAYARRVRTWAEKETRRAEHDEAFFVRQYGPQLLSWLERSLEATRGRRRSVDLPAGRIGLRKGSLKLEVTDILAASAWCGRNSPHAAGLRVVVNGPLAFEMAAQVAVRWPDAAVSWSVHRSQLAAHLKASGDVPDGIRVIEPSEELYVR
jgi:hypothetical protein